MATATFDHRVPADVPYCQLDCARAWEGLSESERLYAHEMSRASWSGALICLHQTSPASPAIFDLFQRLFRVPSSSPERLAQICPAFVEYAGSFYGNMGEYLSFGDTKIIPRCSREEFRSCVAESHDVGVTSLLTPELEDAIFSLDPQRVRQLGLAPGGVSAYYSGDPSEADVAEVQRALDSAGISAYNTRMAKLTDGSYRVRIASADPTGKPAIPRELRTDSGKRVAVEFGDYSRYLRSVVGHVRNAVNSAQSTVAAEMLGKYAESFDRGDIEDHREAQRLWVKDKGPSVETNIGFIESYRDPFGVRGEWEGWVAVVDRVMTKRLGVLVDSAPELLPLLPWGAAFEKPVFLKPDFTAIDVVAYGSSGIPLGINLPNYNDIRQTDGFKNVALANSMRAVSPNERLTFLFPADESFLRPLRSAASEIQVGLHELLGHGSGRMFTEGDDGFNPSEVVSPLTGAPIASWYQKGQTYEGVFRDVASAMEECRAEAVGLLLCTRPEVLRIFGHEPTTDGTVHDVTYANWLSMVRMGALSLEFFSPNDQDKRGGKWRQAHSQARFAILRTLLRAGNGLATVRLVGNNDAVIELDRTKIISVGVPAISKLLTTIQVARSTADYTAGEAFFGELTAVPRGDAFLADLRSCAIAQRKPRRVFVQPHTYIDANGKVQLQVFDASPVGIVNSFLARFGADAVDFSVAI